MKFVDTNIFIRYLTRDDESKAQACYKLFQQVREGDEELFTTETVIAEIAYVLSSPRSGYRLGHEEIRDRLLPVITLRNLRIPTKGVILRALDVYATSPSLDFEDASAVAHSERQGVTEIVSYDKDFDLIPGIRRLEP